MQVSYTSISNTATLAPLYWFNYQPYTKVLSTTTTTILKQEPKKNNNADCCFIKYQGQNYLFAKDFGDRNNMRRVLVKYEIAYNTIGFIKLMGQDLKIMKDSGLVHVRTSCVNLYTEEFYNYFKNNKYL